MISECNNKIQQNNFVTIGKEVSLSSSTNQHQKGTWPEARYRHQAFIYKNKLFVHGGTTIPSSNFIDDNQDIFYYDLQKSTEPKWEKVKTKCLSKQLEIVSGHSGVVNLNNYYMFGGSNSNNKQNNLLWRLNLDTYEWNKIQQKGEVPSARQCAFLMYLQQNWLVLYGGVSNNLVEIYNNFHFYNMDTRYWSKCEGSFTYQAYSRLNSALCSINNKLFMFGGTYRNRKNQQKFLNDFYQLLIIPPVKKIQGKIQIRRLISNVMPEARAGHSLVSLKSNYLILYGGENEENLGQNFKNINVSLAQNMWIYNIEINTWHKFGFNKESCLFRTMATCNIMQNKLYVFGGLIDYSSVLNDLREITIDIDQISKYGRKKAPCLKCYEKKCYTKTQISNSSQFIQQISGNIQFPFAAFGLLVDNAMSCGASHINIYFQEKFGSQKVNTIRIQDNSKIKWTDDELIDSIINYESSAVLLPYGVDKKIKAATLKQNNRRQYGMNLKAASLRIGQSFLFVNLSPTEFYYRIILVEKTNVGAHNQKYVVYFYTYCWYDRNDIKPDMIETRKYVQSKYYDYIKDTFLHKYAKNTVFIFNPRISLNQNAGQEEQMKIYKDHNDIIYGPLSNIETLILKNGYSIFECVDISLRAYLTCLYLKNQTTIISLSVKKLQLAQIYTQVFLQKVDKLCRSKHILEISSVFQYDLKIIELYYLYNLKSKIQFFSNGLLIYHKNRLVMRYKYPLGQLISRKYYKTQNNPNFLRLFGFLELPEHIPINMYKTACTYPIIMQKILTRIKCVSKYFKKSLHKMSIEPDYKRNAPSRMNDEELLQQNNEIESEDKKRKINKNRQMIKHSQAIISFRQSKRLSEKVKAESNNNISQERQDFANSKGSNNYLKNDRNDQMKSNYNKFTFSAQKSSFQLPIDDKVNAIKTNELFNLKQNQLNKFQNQNICIKYRHNYQGQQNYLEKNEIFDEVQVIEDNNMEQQRQLDEEYQDEQPSQQNYSSNKNIQQYNKQQPFNGQQIYQQFISDEDEEEDDSIQQQQGIQNEIFFQQKYQQKIIDERQQYKRQSNNLNQLMPQENYNNMLVLDKNGKQLNRHLNGSRINIEGSDQKQYEQNLRKQGTPNNSSQKYFK